MDLPLDFLAPPQGPDEIGRLGPYRVLKVLGAGGMGIVLLADDPTLCRKVALKVMHPDAAAVPSARQRFLREARHAAAVPDDHVIPINQVGEDRGVPYMVMPYVEGETLEERLRRAGGAPLPLTEALPIGRQIAAGLAAAHERGLVHRDVKPSNVWLEAGKSRLKILDFGLALDPTSPRLTQTGVVVGTPAYMAPEQADGDEVSPRADLFSLGCVLYQMCTGAPPFRGETRQAILQAVRGEPPAPPRSRNAAIPPALEELILRLLAKQPTDRPADAAAVVAAIEAIERAHSVPTQSASAAAPAPALPAAAVETTTKAVRRRVSLSRATLAAASLVAVVLAVLLAVRLTGFGGAPPPTAPGRPGGPADPAAPPPAAGPSPLDALNADNIPLLERFDGQPKELVAVLGHRNPESKDKLVTLAFLPDGGHLLTGGVDGRPQLWDVPNGRVEKRLEREHGGFPTTCVAVSSDGRYAVIGAFARAAALWDLTNGEKLNSLGVDFGNIQGDYAVAFLADDAQVLAPDVSRDASGVVRRWSRDGKELTPPFQAHLKSVNGLAVSPDGKHFVSAGEDQIMYLWAVNHLDGPRDRFDHTAAVNCVAYSTDGHVLSGSADGKMWLWEPEGDSLKKEATIFPEKHTDGVASVAFSPDGKLLASSGLDGRVVVRETASRHRVFEWNLRDWKLRNGAKARGLAFAPDGRHLAIATNLDVVLIFRLANAPR